MMLIRALSKRCVILGRMRHFRCIFPSDRRWTHAQARLDSLESCYNALGVSANCDSKELKDAYVKLAKEYHPDSGREKADAHQFSYVEQAYRKIVERRKSDGAYSLEEAEEEVVFDIQHTAPQHRQYLSHEGIGYGTPSQREKQYQQYRVHKAAERVHEYSMQRDSGAEAGTSLVIKDKRAARQIKTRTGIDRLVEDLIQESMQKGEFDNLPGKGKPLRFENHNPLLDFTTHNINRILVDNGYAPEWVMLQAEIRKDLGQVRHELLRVRTQIGAEAISDSRRWSKQLRKLKDQLDIINVKVHKLNMLVPALHMQIIPYTVDREVRKCLAEYEVKLTTGQLPCIEEKTVESVYVPLDEPLTFRTVVNEIKALFRKRPS